VTIRIREKGSFASGSDAIEPEFIPVIKKIEGILGGTRGQIKISGHTDNLPIDNEYFRSNWELSAGRAGSVTRELLRSRILDKNRFVINGYADTKPIADNSTREGRAQNRRVEITVVQGDQGRGKVIGVDEPKTELETEDSVNNETETETGTETETATELDPTTEDGTETEPDADSGIDTEGENQIEYGPELPPGFDTGPEVEIEAEPEADE